MYQKMEKLLIINYKR